MSEHPLHLFRYCPQCGSPRFTENNEKSKRCEACGFVYYFNPSTATVALITDADNRLLVCRRAKDPARGTLDLPGGFVDIGETAEDGVRREVKEETGLEVSEVTFLFSLPNIYPYSGFEVHTVDMFFRCGVGDISLLRPSDDVMETFFVPMAEICPADFGLLSIRRGLKKIGIC
ncbi:MAG: NUDIX domain-containing protein [Prevotellaceae bacterium]|nr:NUDIX domain-containing protein [Prevotellaceae bacterium]